MRKSVQGQKFFSKKSEFSEQNSHSFVPLFTKLTIGLFLILSFGGLAFAAPILAPGLFSNNKNQPQLATNQQTDRAVLAATSQKLFGKISFNIPAFFTDTATFEQATTFNGKATFNNDIQITNHNLDLGTGQLTASNVVYSVTAGNGITVTGGQRPVVSNTGVLSVQGQTGAVSLLAGTGISFNGLTVNNTGVTSFQGQSGSVTLTAGSGISISGTTISSSGGGGGGNSFGNITVGSTTIAATAATDTVTFTAGTGITLTPDSTNKKLTFATTGSAFSSITSGTNTSAAMIVGSGASLDFTGTGTINASTLLGNTWAAPAAIGTGTANTGAFTTLTGTTVNALTLTANADGFGIAGGTTSRSLTVTGSNITLTGGGNTLTMTGNASLNQNVLTTSSPTFAGLTLSSFTGNNAVVYATTGTGALATATTTTSNLCLTSAGTNIPTWASCTGGGGGTNFWQLTTGALAPADFTNDLLVGGAATASAKFQIFSSTGNATTSGNLTFNTAGQIQTTKNQTLTIGSSSTGNIVLSGFATGIIHSTSGVLSSSAVALGGSEVTGTLLAGNGGTGISSYTIGDLIYASGATTLSKLADVSTGSCLVSGGIGTAPSWSSCSTSSGNLWTSSTGAIYPVNSTEDLLVGGTATNSAKFAFINVNSGTPIASVSAGAAGATYISANGTLATTEKQSLILGDTNTGNIVLNGFATGIIHSTSGVLSSSAVALGSSDVSGTLGVGNGGTGITSYTIGDLIYASGATTLSKLADVSTGSCLVSGGIGAAPSWSSCSTSSGNLWTSSSGAIYPVNSTEDLLVGGTATNSAKFAFINVNSGTPIASVSAGSAGGVYLSATGTLATTTKQTLTLGDTNTGNIVLNGFSTGIIHSTSGVLSSSAINLAGGATEITGLLPLANGGTNANLTAVQGGIVYSGASAFAISAAGTSGQCLLSAGTGTPTWGNCTTGGGTNYWTSTLGALYPVNSTMDLLIGGTATSSAKFAVLNVNSGTPTASVSAGTAGGAYLSATGTVATTAKQTLTLGDANTGNVIFGQGGNVGIGTTNPTSLFNVSGGDLKASGVGGSITLRGTGTATDLITTNSLYVNNGVNQNIYLLPNSTGKIAVGSTTPLATFDIHPNSGTLAIASISGQTSFAGLVVDNSLGDLFTASNSGATKFTISNSGVVTLLGGQTSDITTQDGDSLSINTGAAATMNIGTTNTTTITIGRSGQILDLNSPTIQVGNGTTTNIQNTGNGGITILPSGTGNLTLGQNSGTGNVRILPNAGGQAALIVNDQGSGDIFTASQGGNTKFVINNSGNVGIGVTTPTSFALQVAGNIGPNATTTYDLGSTTALWNHVYSKWLINSAGLSVGTTQQVGTTGTQPIATIAAKTSFAGLVVDNSGVGDIFAASSSGVSQFTIANNGILTDAAYGTGIAHFNSAGVVSSSAINLAGGSTEVTGLLPLANGGTNANLTAVQGGIVYSGASAFAISAAGTSGQCLLSGGTGTPTWGSCTTGGGTNYWTSTLGALYPVNSTMDLLIGGTATSSAKFAFINNNTGSPTASISGNLSLVVPTGSNPAETFNTLNGGSLNFQTSVGGDAGLTSRFYIANNGNVGIGNTNPAEKLQLTAGNIELDNNQYIAFKDSGGSERQALIWSSSNNLQMQNGNSAGSIQIELTNAANTTGSVQFLTKNTERMRIDANGNVGIGTTAPIATLDLRSNIGTLSVASISGATSLASLVVDNSGVGDIFTASSSGLNRFVITQAGNVGIGTTNPTNPLQVAGTIGIQNSNTITGVTNYTEFNNGISVGGATTYNISNAGVGTFATGSNVTSNGATYFQIGSTGGSGSFGRIYVDLQRNGDFALTDGNANSYWYNYGGTSVTGIPQGASGIGLNVTSPHATLDVEGGNTGGNAALLVNQNGANTNDIFTASAGGTTKFVISNSGVLTASNYGTGIAHFSSAGVISSSAINLASTDVTGTLGAGNGGTGIASYAVGDLLYASGATTLSKLADVATGSCLISGGVTTAPSWGSCSTSNYWNLANGTVYPINSTLDLLIGGTATTSAKFAVLNVNSGTPTASVSAGAAGAAYLTATGKLATTAKQTLTFGDANTGNIIFSQGGNIGIGTTTPGANLEVDSTGTGLILSSTTNGATFNDIAKVLDGSLSNGNQMLMKFGHDDSFKNIGYMSFLYSGAASDTNALTFGFNGVDNILNVTAGSSGRVGIGTLTPQSNLDVSGNTVGTIFANITNLNTAGTTLLNFPETNGGFPFFIKRYGSTNANANLVEIWNAQTAAGSDIRFGVGNQERVRLTSTGLVGVNVTAPSALFDVRGVGINTLSGIIPIASFSGKTSFAGMVVDNSGVGDVFTASTSGKNRFTVGYNGYVGIGGTATSSLTAALDITALGTNVDLLDLYSPNRLQSLQFGWDGSHVIMGANGQSITFVNTLFNAGGTFDNGNNILNDISQLGVGTTTELATADIRATDGTTAIASISGKTSFAGLVVDNSGHGDLFTASTSGLPRFTIGNTGNVSISDASYIGFSGPTPVTAGTFSLYGSIGGSETALNGPGASGVITFKVNNSEKMRMDSSGNLVLGATTANAKLDVRGSLGTVPVATVSGKTSFAAMVVDNSGTGDIFTASSSGKARFTIQQSGVVLIGDTTNGLTFDYVNGGPTYAGTARPTKQITLSPEYAGAILSASGSATTNGQMTSDASPSANFRTYYNWTSSQTSLQDYTIAVRVTLPKDFSAWATSGNALAIDMNTPLTTTTANKLDVILYNPTFNSSTPVLYDQAEVSTSQKTWKTIGYANTLLANWATAGQTATIYLKVYSKDNQYVQVGDIVLNYLAKF